MSRSWHPGHNRGRWAALRRRVFDRDGWRCRKCGKAGRLECDHVVPVERGGAPWDMGNIQTLCRGCHIDKHRKPLSRDRQDWHNRLIQLARGR